jgi:hypothetical protein
METFKELLNFACFIIIMYFLFCVLQYAPQIEQLIIEMKGGAIWKEIIIHILCFIGFSIMVVFYFLLLFGVIWKQ